MKKTVPPVAEAPALEEELPVRVQEALGELAAAAREGLLALSVGVGLGVLAELMEEEVVGVVGAKGKHDRERVAVSLLAHADRQSRSPGRLSRSS